MTARPASATSAAAAALLATLASACADSATAPLATPAAPAAQITSISSDALWEKRITGVTGAGSTYAVFMPHDWNGGVVYYAHGFVDAALPVTLPSGTYVEQLRDNLGTRGFAVAYSSYSENGFAVKDGIQRTHQLRGLFRAATNEVPTRSYLIGQSLGGAVTSALAEEKSAQYDGVMPVCGMVGGSLTQTQYLGHVRTLFDVLFPGVIPGSTLSMPANVDINTQIAGPVQAAVIPAGIPRLFAMATSPQTPLPTPDALNPANIPLTLQSLITALSFHARGINDILDRTNGSTPFDNAATVYTSPLWTAAVQAGVNATIARFTFGMPAFNHLSKNWTPSGDLRVPTLTLHNRFDPVVPIFHEDSLALAAARSGKSNLLVQRFATQPYGHCAFDANEVVANFDLLVQWVETGVKPQ